MSYTLKYTGQEIDDILDRANEGGALDVAIAAEKTRAEAAEALKAPIASPAFTGTPTAPTPAAGDDSTNVATTGFVAGEIRTEASSRDAAIEDAISEEVTARNEAIEAAQQEAIDEAVAEALAQALPTDTASGSIASFPDGAENVPIKEMVGYIEPIQDLHGYDSPWPEGGGKNKSPWTISALKATPSQPTGSSWSGNTYTHNDVTWTFETLPDGDTITKITANGTANGQSDLVLAATYNAGNYIASALPVNGSYTTFHANFYGTNIIYAQGASVSIPADETSAKFHMYINNGYTASNVTFYPMLRLSTETDATFAPYSNICPISGWTGAEITVNGINLWDEEWELGSYNTTTGQKQTSSNSIRCSNYIRIEGNTTYYCTKGTTAASSNFALFFYDEYLNYLGVQYKGIETFTSPANAKYMTFYMNTGYGTTYNHDISINYPSTDTAYHSGADNTTYSVSWSDHGTVYHGTLSYLGNGTWKVYAPKACSAISKDWTWYKNSTYLGGYYASRSILGAKSAPFSCSHARYVSTFNEYVFGTCIADSNFNIRIMPESSTLNDWKDYIDAQALAGTPIQIYYDLITPVEFTITGPDPETLLGDNNVWADTGDIKVTYRADTALFVNKKIAELQALVLEQ